MSSALLIDFGSSCTKVRAIDLERRAAMASAQGPSTATTDVHLGLEAALKLAMADLDVVNTAESDGKSRRIIVA